MWNWGLGCAYRQRVFAVCMVLVWGVVDCMLGSFLCGSLGCCLECGIGYRFVAFRTWVLLGA